MVLVDVPDVIPSIVFGSKHVSALLIFLDITIAVWLTWLSVTMNSLTTESRRLAYDFASLLIYVQYCARPSET